MQFLVILHKSHFSLNFAHIAGAFFFLCAPLVLLAPEAKVHKNLKDIISARKIVTRAVKMMMMLMILMLMMMMMM